MNVLFLLNFVICLAIAVVIAINFFKHYQNKNLTRTFNYFLIILIFYLLISALNFLWLIFDFIKYNAKDFLIIYSILLVAQTSILFQIILIITNNKKLSYFLIIYLASFLSLFSHFLSFPLILILISFLLLLILFLSFSSYSEDYRKAGNFGIFYASVSVLLFILIYFNIKFVLLFSIISNFLFLFFSLSLMHQLNQNPPQKFPKKQKKESYFFSFIKYFVFIIILTNFVFLGTLSLHEFGHFSVSKFYDCEYRKIVYEENYPYTELLCQDLPTNTFVILGGVALPLLVAMVLFILGGKFIKEISLLMIGFNLLASYGDFLDLGVSDNLILFFVISGLIFLIIGIILLAKSRTEEAQIISI